MSRLPFVGLSLVLFLGSDGSAQVTPRPRARDLGVVIGIFAPGRHNAITDVPGVRVGHTTIQSGDSLNTGVTAILPHGGNVFRERVPAALFVLNGYGKLVGLNQIREHGEIETPIVLTCTLCVWKVADALAAYELARPGMESVLSISPVVGETNDGGLNDIRSRPIGADHVRAAVSGASEGSVAEGSVGAGTGTTAFGWKGGIGTSSRQTPLSVGGYLVGVLVQSNFGGMLTINGAPVGRELGRYSFQREIAGERPRSKEGGSIMVVVATNAPLDPLNLERLAKRAVLGLGRTGSFGDASSGDFVLAFSTAESVRRHREDQGFRGATSGAEVTVSELPYYAMSPLFEAVVEATEEAVINSLFRATAARYRGKTIDALPIDQTLAILRKYDVLHWDRQLPPRRP